MYFYVFLLAVVQNETAAENEPHNEISGGIHRFEMIDKIELSNFNNQP